MDNQPLESEQQFKHSFNQGLVELLSSSQSAGAFILSLANFIQHPNLFEANKSLIYDAYAQIALRYQNAITSAIKLSDAPDDIAVMNSIIHIGIENIKASDVRETGEENWSIYFNQLRSFRPERMSSQKAESINVKFDSGSFNFNKPFLRKEIFLEQELNNKQVSLLYNKFPFADFHGLLVIGREKEYNQYLTEDIFHYIWSVYLKLKKNIPNQVVSYNSLGAGASVNHLHFQTCIYTKVLSVSSKRWRHNGGGYEYPAECMVFNNEKEAWDFIANLQKTNTPFNLVFINQVLYCLPRKLEAVINEKIPQIGWFEMAGSFSIADEDTFQSLQSSQIKSALGQVSRRK